MILLHYTGMKDGPSAVDWLCEPASQVSCHYVVREDGRVLQLVPDNRRAWHAGRSVWGGVTDINSASIGVEIVNGGHDFGLPVYPETQIDALIALCHRLVDRYAIKPQRLLAHSDVAPSRKRDPGEHFPWNRLATSGLGMWVETPEATEQDSVLDEGSSGPAVKALQEALTRYGYGIMVTGLYDEATISVVRAFQRHFRPGRIDGRADDATQMVLRHLLDASSASGEDWTLQRKPKS